MCVYVCVCVCVWGGVWGGEGVGVRSYDEVQEVIGSGPVAFNFIFI